MKLTDKEKNILERLQKGVKCSYMGYMGRFNPNPYWYMSDDMKKCTIQIKGLKRKGYIETKSKNDFGTEMEIIIIKKEEFNLK